MVVRIIVRKAGLEDIEKITLFNLKMADETENIKLERSTVLKGVKSVLLDPNKGFYLVAEDSDISEIVGQLLVTFEWSDWRDKWFWWIQSVYVHEKYRNQKIFSQLFRNIVEIAKKRRDICGLRLYVEKHNEQAKKVYEALGMTIAPYEVYEKNF